MISYAAFPCRRAGHIDRVRAEHADADILDRVQRWADSTADPGLVLGTT